MSRCWQIKNHSHICNQSFGARQHALSAIFMIFESQFPIRVSQVLKALGRAVESSFYKVERSNDTLYFFPSFCLNLFFFSPTFWSLLFYFIF